MECNRSRDDGGGGGDVSPQVSRQVKGARVRRPWWMNERNASIPQIDRQSRAGQRARNNHGRLPERISASSLLVVGQCCGG